MTDQQDRERESKLSDQTKFEEMADEVEEEQQRVAQRLATDPVVTETSDEE
jgi:hypothetical protein